MASFGQLRAAANDAASHKHHTSLRSLNAFERHQHFMADYVRYYGSEQHVQERRLARTQTDLDVLQQEHRFIRSDADDASNTWEVRLARRYYNKLYKEYCIADLSRYKEGKLGLRWRTEKEVIVGKGQFVCGAKGCEQRDGLTSYEVNFVYKEACETKQALVKLRVCDDCAHKLNYKKEQLYKKVTSKLKRVLEAEEASGTRVEKKQRVEDSTAPCVAVDPAAAESPEAGLVPSFIKDIPDADPSLFEGLFP